MKKLIVLGLLIVFGSIQADAVDKINPYVDKYGKKAEGAIEKRFDARMGIEIYNPLRDKPKEIQKILDEAKKNEARNAAFALWAKIKEWFGKSN